MQGTVVALFSQRLAFTCHSGVLAGRGLPNSLDGIRGCLEAGAFRIEVDVHSMADAEYLVSHASRLEESTTSRGPVSRLTREDAGNLRRNDDPSARPPLLSEVVELVKPYSSQLQLDLKDWRPLSAERVAALVALTEPLGDRVIVSSGQDWNLRALHHMSIALRLGFDPDHYLASGRREVPMPARVGAYGYRDDHPLAIGRTQAVVEYLGERINNLVALCPFVSEFFVEVSLLLQAASDGVSIADLLHVNGIATSAWTLDYESPQSLEPLSSLVECGVEYITTNTAEQFVATIGSDSRDVPGSY